MPSIDYRLVQHRGENRILVCFNKNMDWNKRIKAVAGVCWSRTLKGWTIPDTVVNRQKCGLTTEQHSLPAAKPTVVKEVSKSISPRLSENNSTQLQLFIQQLQLKAYSPSTIRTYRTELLQLLQLLGKVPVQDLQSADLQRYLLYCLSNGLTEHSVHSRMNALKFYYEQVLHREKMFFDIPRPKKPIQLPKVLNENELKRLFAAIRNIKHKAILFTAYSAGLRVSEVVNLRVQDVDSQRMQLFIQKSKGKKDRVVPLSILVLDVLRQYVKKLTVMPQHYLFTAPDGIGAYSARSAQKLFQEAKKMAGIHKDVSFHSLRHSFATHLLEHGIDVKYIKDLLGHFDIRTTERYLHVSRDKLINIVSPLDRLYLEQEEEQLWIGDTDNLKRRIEKH